MRILIQSNFFLLENYLLASYEKPGLIEKWFGKVTKHDHVKRINNKELYDWLWNDWKKYIQKFTSLLWNERASSVFPPSHFYWLFHADVFLPESL